MIINIEVLLVSYFLFQCKIEKRVPLKSNLEYFTKSNLVGWLIDYLNDILVTSWQVNWLTGWLVDWLTGWLVDCLTGWLVDWLTGWLDDWLNGWLVDWLTGWLVDWLTGWLVDWLTGWLVDCLSELLLFILIDWLTYWLDYKVTYWQFDSLKDVRLTEQHMDSLTVWQIYSLIDSFIFNTVSVMFCTLLSNFNS